MQLTSKMKRRRAIIVLAASVDEISRNELKKNFKSSQVTVRSSVMESVIVSVVTIEHR